MCKGCDMRTERLTTQARKAEALAASAEALFKQDGSEVIGQLAAELRALALEYAGPIKARRSAAPRPLAPIIEASGQAAMRV